MTYFANSSAGRLCTAANAASRGPVLFTDILIWWGGLWRIEIVGFAIFDWRLEVRVTCRARFMFSRPCCSAKDKAICVEISDHSADLTLVCLLRCRWLIFKEESLLDFWMNIKLGCWCMLNLLGAWAQVCLRCSVRVSKFTRLDSKISGVGMFNNWGVEVFVARWA